MNANTVISLKDIKETREQIQEDLLASFDGMEDNAKAQMCQIVVDNMKKLVEKLP